MLPSFIKPMLAGSAAEAFDSKNHVFELKWDGIRCLAFIEKTGVRLQSRQLTDITAHIPELGDLRKITPGTVLDVELVVMRNGQPSLLAIQERINLQNPDRIQRLSRSAPAVFLVFDLLYHEFRPLMEQPFIQRRTSLEK
jgi:ATP-dependent DNA ligase